MEKIEKSIEEINKKFQSLRLDSIKQNKSFNKNQRFYNPLYDHSYHHAKIIIN